MGKQDERKKLNKNGALNKAHKRKKKQQNVGLFSSTLRSTNSLGKFYTDEIINKL